MNRNLTILKAYHEHRLLRRAKKLLQKFYTRKVAPLTIVEIGGLKIIKF